MVVDMQIETVAIRRVVAIEVGFSRRQKIAPQAGQQAP